MNFTKDEIKLIREHQSKFISLKYLNNKGNLKQIDFCIYDIESINHLTINTPLEKINGKIFLDPFRSITTTSIFCKLISDESSRSLLEKAKDNASINAEISFWISDDIDHKTENSQLNCQFTADPDDIYSDLRSDIVLTLEKLNIKTNYHFHGILKNESIISINGRNLLDLADNIIITQYVIKNISARYSLKVSFYYNKVKNLTILLGKTGYLPPNNNKKDSIDIDLSYQNNSNLYLILHNSLISTIIDDVR